MSSGQCQHCGSTDIDIDTTRGDAVCTQCGSVLEESVIVTEVQFVQDSSGASRAIGKLVSAEDGCAAGLNLGHRYGIGRESRATTLQNAKQSIQLLASKLQLNSRCVDTAFNFYKVALSRKLTKGRKSTHVIAACVYMVCRKEETAHMLLDLSDVLQVSVYELGKTYLRLSTALCINTPAIDPSLYILRFAHQLEFGDKTHEVSMTAARLVQRMKKDWMHTGRRPSGLCGAALLVAARLHNFNRTVDDIIKVVKVCQATVRKRLAEFGDTPSSRLTLDEFMKIDLEEEQDPPAFKNARKKLHDLDNTDKMNAIKKQVSELQKLIETALESTRKKSKFEKYSLFTPADDETSNQTNDSTDGNSTSNINQFMMHETMETIKDVITNGAGSDSALSAESSITPLIMAQSDSLNDSAFSSDSNGALEPTVEIIDEDGTVLSIPKVEEKDAKTELELAGLDDNELDAYIMDNHEFKQKNDLWHKSNADYLLEQKEKEERKLREEEENANKPDKKRRRRQKRLPIHANTPGEAIEKMMQQRKISFKLNYDVLKNLNPEGTVTEEPEAAPVIEAPVETGPVKRVRSKPKPKAPQAPVPLSIRQGMSDIIGNTRKKEMLVQASEEQQEVEEEEERPAKKPKLSEPEIEAAPIVAPTEEEEVEEDEYDDEDEPEETAYGYGLEDDGAYYEYGGDDDDDDD